MTRNYLLGLWVVVLLAPAAGDIGLYLAARTVRDQLTWVDVRLTRPVPDSLKRAVSRYLRDSLHVTSERDGDTLVLRIPRAAERSMDGMVDSLRVSGRRLLPWLLGALVLLHVPLVVALLVTIVSLADRERRDHNYARTTWQDPGA